MKKQYYKLGLILMLFLWGMLNMASAVQLNGTYTIDPAQPASVNNFNDLQSAVNYLSGSGSRPDNGPANSAPFGVSGSVVFQLASGTFNLAQSLIVPEIDGTSATRTITFNGMNVQACIVSGTVTGNALIRLDQCRYVRFENLTVVNLATTDCAGITIIGNTSSDAGSGCAVKNCTVQLPNLGSNQGIAVLVTGNTNGYATGSHNANNIEISNNTITGAYVGISDRGAQNSFYNLQHKINNNLLTNIHYNGIEVADIYNAIELQFNQVSIKASGDNYGSGISIDNCNNTSVVFAHQIVGNRIKNAGRYGLLINSANGSAQKPTRIHNNMVAGGFRDNSGAGIYLNVGGGYATEMLHNTIVYDAPGVTGSGVAAFYYTGSTELLCKNNIFINQAVSGKGLPVYFASDPPNTSVNANVYVNNASALLLYRNGQFFDQGNYKAVSSGGDSSSATLFTQDFVSPDDLHLTGSCQVKGSNYNLLSPTDIDGQTRTATPAIGCDEPVGTAMQNDVSIQKLLNPKSQYVSGMQNVKVQFRNAGTAALTSCNFVLKVNNTMVSSFVYTGSLPSCAIDSFQFATAYNFSGGNSDVITVYAELPNNGADAYSNNDTLRMQVFGALNAGTYTIDSLGTGPNNFVSFEAALNALKAGISGPVVFAVAAGTYTLTNPINIDSIMGSSVSNTVTFDGGSGNAASRILVGTIDENPLIRFNQCQYVSIRNLSVRNLSASSCAAIAIVGSYENDGGTGCSVKNCIIQLPNSSSSSSVGVGVTPYANGYYESSQRAGNVEISENTFSGGNIGVMIQGMGEDIYNKGYVISKNTFQNTYSYGIKLSSIYNAVQVTGNTISMEPTGSISGYGIQMNYCQNNNGLESHKIIGNTVKNAGQYGIYIFYANGTDMNATRIYNNMVLGGIRNINGSGLFLYASGGSYSEVLHNTVRFDAEGVTNTNIAAFFYGGSQNLLCKNNIFYNAAKTGNAVAAYFSDNPTGAYSVNANIYNNDASDKLVYRGGLTYPGSIALMPGAGGDSSYTGGGTMNFVSAADYHLASSCLKGADMSAYVSTDIDGQTRLALPDIGCDEVVTPVVNEVAVEEILTPSGLFSGPLNVKVRFKNMGSAAVSSCDFTLKVNNVVISTYSYSGNLATCASDTFSFPTSFDFTGGPFNTQVYAENPNGTADGYKLNDTLTQVFYGALSAGIYTIDSLGSGLNNYTSFQNAVKALKGGVVGPVVFNVAAGTYTFTSLLEIPPVLGASQVNTITFDGGAGNATTRIITGSVGPYSTLFYVNKASYIRFSNLQMINNYPGDASCIKIEGDDASTTPASGCAVKNCILDMTYSQFNYGSFGIWISGRRANAIELDSNTIRGGSWGIALGGMLDTSCNKNMKVRGNNISGQYLSGIDIASINNTMDVANNRINMNPSSSQSVGLNMSNCQVNGSNIYNNIIRNASLYGFHFQYCQSPSFKHKAYNNMVIGAGIYNESDDIEFYHNTVLNTQESQPNSPFLNAAFSARSTTNYLCKNNIFINSSNTGIPVFIAPGYNPPAGALNYNIYYNTKSGSLLSLDGIVYNANTYKSISAGGDSSFNQLRMELFVSDTDFHYLSACGGVVKGADFTSIVATDIDGQPRNSPPDIGCDEGFGTLVGTDIALIDLVSPKGLFNGSQSVSVNIRNAGSVVLTSCDLVLKVNNTIIATEPYTGILGPCMIDTVTFSVPVNFTSGMLYHLSVYATNVNGGTDIDATNDTLNLTLRAAFSQGLYTIDSNGSGPNNFISFEAAIDALKAGITGSVVFSIAPDTINVSSTLEIPLIEGVSAINTITFDGGSGNASTRILSGNVANAPILRINKTKYIEIKNISIVNTYQGSCAGIGIIGTYLSKDATGCAVKLCKISLPNAGSNSSIAISLTDEVNGYSVNNGTGADSIIIDSNEIHYARSGIMLRGNSRNNSNIGIKARGNTLSGIYYSGVRFSNIQNGIEIINNDVDMSISGDQSSYGIETGGCSNSGTYASHLIIGNKVKNAGGSGITIEGLNGSSVFPSKVVNNLISGGFRSQSYVWPMFVYTNQGEVLHILHNTVILDAEGSDENSAALYYYPYGSDQLICKNNIFINAAVTGSGLAAYFGTELPDTAVNSNIYYNASGSSLLMRNEITFSQDNFLNLKSLGDTSYLQRPLFLSSTDFKPLNLCQKGINTNAMVPFDLDQQVRPATPEIGCYEGVSTNEDIAMVEILNPVPPFNGSQTVKVKFRNNGANMLSSARFYLKVNTNVVDSYAYVGALPKCEEDSFTFAVPVNFTLGDSFNVQVYSSLPNGVLDTITANDTVRKILYGAFTAGTYTIDPNGSGPNNFPSFTAACTALSRVGITGPVLFNVAAGTYTEQASVENVIGASAINTITFDGMNAQTRVLQYGQPGLVNAHTFLIRNTPYVTVRNLTIKSTSAEIRNTVLHIRGGSHFTKVKHCRFETLGGGHIQFSDANPLAPYSYTQEHTNGITKVDSCEIDSNHFRMGAIGVYMVGNNATNNKVTNNIFDTIPTSILMEGVDGILIHRNVFNNPTVISFNDPSLEWVRQYGTSIYIKGNSLDSNIIQISANRVIGYVQGIYFEGGNMNGVRSKVINNMVCGANGRSSIGIALQYTINCDVFHNSVLVDAKFGQTGAGYGFYHSGATGSDVRNNIFACEMGIPIRIAHPVYPMLHLDYNAYYKKDTATNPYDLGTFVEIDDIRYSRNNFISGSGYNAHSLLKSDLDWVSMLDLHQRGACALGGDPDLVIARAVDSSDFDGDIRSNPPMLGADEIVTGLVDIGVEQIVSPGIPYAGTLPVQIRIKNYGIQPIVSAVLKCSVNGGIPQSFAYLGSLQSCDTTTVTFSTPVQFLSGNNYTIKVWSQSPNSGVDAFPMNDTISRSTCASLNGTYTINPNGTGSANFISVAAAIEQLYCGGVSGPVQFNLSSGTHIAQFQLLDMIPGASSSNKVTFQSAANNRDSVIVMNPITGIYSATVATINASHVRLKALTLQMQDAPTVSSTFTIVQIGDGRRVGYSTVPENVSIENCNVFADPVADEWITGIEHTWEIIPSKKITAQYNTVKGCNIGIQVAAGPVHEIDFVNGQLVVAITAPLIFSDSNMITNNTIIDSKLSGIRVWCSDNTIIENNYIYSNASQYSYGSPDYAGLSVEFNGEDTRIRGNKILGSSGGRGIHLDHVSGILVNNSVALTSTSNPVFSGLELYPNTLLYVKAKNGYPVYNLSVQHNSVYTKSKPGTASKAADIGAFGDYRNNAFVSDSGYAVRLYNRATLTGSVFDYNNIVNRKGSLLGSFEPADALPGIHADLTTWRMATGKDAHSISYYPGWTNDTLLVPAAGDSANWSLNGRGIHLAGVTTDINGNPRPTNIAQGAPDIGAYEFTPTSTPPAAIANPALPVAGTTQSFTFGGDTVAKITWAPASSVPSSVTVRQYSGEKPPAIASAAEHMYVYATVEMPNPGSAPNYTLSLNYRDSWLGTVANPNESSVKLAKKVASNPWFTIGTSSIDTSANTLSASGNTEVSATFSAANIINPLPVKLLTLTATNLNGDVHVNWATATEVNSNYFMVERSVDGKSFKAIGKVKANGHTGNLSNYALVDAKAPFNQASTLYYRLKIVDADGSFDYSDRVSVSEKQVAKTPKPLVYPNPFSEEVFATLSLEEASNVKIMVTDITGKVVLARETELSKGVQTLKLSTVDLHPGMYFMGIEVGGMVHTQKITRY